MENVKAALAAVGAGFGHVVKINTFMLDMRHLPILRDIRRTYVTTAKPPASTTVAVPALAVEGALLEVEVIAVLP